MASPEPTLIAINIGNTRTQIGAFREGKLEASQRFGNDDLAAALSFVGEQWSKLSEEPTASVVMASVNNTIDQRFTSMLIDQLSVDVYHVGLDMPVPVGTQLDPETITGIDRLLNAAAAYDRIKQACVVIDAGTAVTVDFVDGEGTFHGGAIAPGARMQLRALHDHTSALPEIEFARPNEEAFGRSTAQAMLTGVFFGIRGMVWKLVERYAERYGAYPSIIATGGDAKTLFENDELVETIVDDLTLRGIVVSARHALAGASDDD